MKAAVVRWSAVVAGGFDGLAADLRAGIRRSDTAAVVSRGPIPPGQWRRMSRLSRLAGHAVAQLGDLPPDVPLVWGTAFGESVTCSQVLDRLCSPDGDKVSPLAFQGSVYNAAAARLSLSFGLRGPTETVCAGGMTALASVARGVEWLQHAPAALVVIGDERGWAVQTALDRVGGTMGEGCVALLLGAGDDFEIRDGVGHDGVGSDGIRRLQPLPYETAFVPVAGALDPADAFGVNPIGGLLAWLLLGDPLVEQDDDVALTGWWHRSPPPRVGD